MQLIERARPRAASRSRARGFTLLEVMVALLITAVGLLGIAKIQALAYASTGSASMRSLVALQAAGLAASMHANRNYWANGLAPSPLTITGTTISDATLNSTTTSCLSGQPACSAAALAAFDLHTWATALNGMLNNSNPVTVITCTATIPLTCTINVKWNEKAVAINSQAAANTTAATFSPAYILFVEP